MAARCATFEEFLAATGNAFVSFGGNAEGTVTFGAPIAGDTVSIGGLTLTAVAVPRTSGSNDWDVSGTPLQLAQSFTDALNDPLNQFVGVVTAAILPLGVPLVTITSVATGFLANMTFVTSNPAEITLDPALGFLDGGEDQINFFLTCSCSMINIECWRGKSDCAHIYLTAHMITVGAGAEAGVTTNKTIDKISVGFGSTSFDPQDSEFASTKWGRLYLALRKTVWIKPLAGRALSTVWPYSYSGRRGGFC